MTNTTSSTLRFGSYEKSGSSYQIIKDKNGVTRIQFMLYQKNPFWYKPIKLNYTIKFSNDEVDDFLSHFGLYYKLVRQGDKVTLKFFRKLKIVFGDEVIYQRPLKGQEVETSLLDARCIDNACIYVCAKTTLSSADQEQISKDESAGYSRYARDKETGKRKLLNLLTGEISLETSKNKASETNVPYAYFRQFSGTGETRFWYNKDARMAREKFIEKTSSMETIDEEIANIDFSYEI